MMRGGVYTIDPYAFTETGFIPTGHRHARPLPEPRRHQALRRQPRAATTSAARRTAPAACRCSTSPRRQIVATWPIPGGGSPDMGNVSADGKTLWLSGRYDDVVYAIDTTTASVTKIPVGAEPHGLTVWPQPGRYSLGHTGNMR